MPRDYDTTIARMAGNIAAGLVDRNHADDVTARRSVDLAFAIVRRIKEITAREEANRDVSTKP